MILIILIIEVLSKCPYQTFNQSQLNNDNFYQEQNYVRGNPYGYGVWTQFAPLRTNRYYNHTKSYFNQTGSFDGFHILNFQSAQKIQTLFYQKYVYKTNIPTLIILQRASGAIQAYTIQQSQIFYEGYWVFTYFSFYYNNKYNFVLFNTGDNTFINILETNKVLSTQDTEARLEHGGHGQFLVGSKEYNLNIFSGRISIINIFEEGIQFFNNDDKQKFQNFLSTCYIPSACQNEQNLLLLREAYTISNSSLNQFVVDIPEFKYSYSFGFWIKREPKQLNSLQEVIFNILGQYQDGNGYIQFLITWINYDLEVLLMHYFELQLTPKELKTDEFNYSQQYVNKTKSYFESWVYLNYEFSQNSVYQIVKYRSYYSCCNEWDEKDILKYKNYRFPTNYKMLVSIFKPGVIFKPYFVQFEGLIANLQLRYCYNSDIQFLNQYNLDCHDLCRTCNGPTKFNCISCYEQQNRIFYSDFNQCFCKNDYEETPDLICRKKFQGDLPQGQQLSIEFIRTELSISFNCNYGYFEVWNDHIFLGCIQCPYFQLSNLRVQCINCLLNSQNWSTLPICDIDYKSDDSIFYSEEYLDYQLKELFLINYDMMSIELCNGCEKLIQEKNNRSIIKQLNGQNNYYLCKLNKYSYDNSCKQCDQNCIYCMDDGNCKECPQQFYLNRGECHKCPEQCDQCSFNNQIDQVLCINCQNFYGKFDQICIKCGYLCEQCEKRINENNGQGYMKCLKCSNDSFISLDGESCYINTQPHCIYPFQYSLKNPENNVFFYNFQPEELQHIKTACSFCSITSYLEAYDNKYFCTPIQDIEKYEGCILLSYSKEDKFVCLIGIKGFLQRPFAGYCTQKIPYCNTCYFQDWENSNFCLLCEDGYYNDYYTTYCKSCPSECATCVETDSSKLLKSSSSVVLKTLIDLSLLGYNYKSRNPNKSQIFLKCTQCRNGYEIHLNKCIKQCPYNCKQCKIVNEQQICTQCKEMSDSNLQIYNGTCIQCPQNCKLCHPRDQQQKQQINPYFNYSKLEYFSHACVSPNQDNLFYDQEIKQFINCENSFQDCQNVINIQIYLYCNKFDLEYYINSLNEEQKMIQGKFHMLFENFDLSLFEYEDYYFYLNKNFVKKVNYQIQFATNQNCLISKEIQFYSNLQRFCFNLIEVNLDFKGSNSTLNLNGLLQFINFQQVTIKDLKINLQNGGIQISNIKGFSLNLETIYLFQDQIQQLTFDNFLYLIEVHELYISNIYIEKANFKYQNGLILISNYQVLQKFALVNFNIKEVQLENTFLFHFNSTRLIEAAIYKVNILQSQFQNSQLISFTNLNDVFKLDNLTIESSIIVNTMFFFDFTLVESIKLSNLLLVTSQLIQSNLIECSNQFQMKEFKFHKLSIKGQSSILTNKYSASLYNIEIEQGSFIDITYSHKQAFILIQNFFNFKFTFIFNKIEMLNNSIDNLYQMDQIIKNVELSIIYVQATNVLFQNLTIQRGIGFSEITIKDCDKFQFLNSVITLHSKYQFKSLFNNQDCVLSQYNKFLYNNFANLQEIQNVHIQEISVTNLILYDSVLFEIQMPSLMYSKFELTLSKFESNILHQINTYQKISLISVNSLNQIDLDLNHVIFSNNLLNLLKDSQPSQQSLILIEASKSQSIIKFCTVKKNINLNGQGTVFYMNSQQILFQNVDFFYNSEFNYDTVKQFLRWGANGTIHFEDLKNAYFVKSYGGNGNLQTRSVSFENVTVVGSSSKQGAAFVLNILENGLVIITNSNFSNLSADLTELSKGGAFYIYSESKYLHILIIDTIFQNILARKLGSIFYITTSSQFFNFTIINSTLSNIFSIQGGLLYIEKSVHKFYSFQMNDCKLQQNQGEFFNFVNSLPQLTSSEMNSLTKDYTFVYCYDCEILIKDFQLSFYPLIPLFQFYGNINLINIYIGNTTFASQLLKFDSVKISDQLTINNLEISSCAQINFSNIMIPQKQISKESTLQIVTDCKYVEIDLPDNIVTNIQSKSNLNQIAFLELLQSQIKLALISLVLVTNTQVQQKIKLVNFNLVNITCSNCINGILSFENDYQTTIIIEKINVLNSQCGENGCISFIQKNQNRMLENQDFLITQTLENPSIKIFNLNCNFNYAKNGGCLYIVDFSILISFSQISGNKAQYGGAVYTRGNKTILIGQNLLIMENEAQFGGGIYCQDELRRNLGGIQLINNHYQNDLNQIDEHPQQIFLQIFKNEILSSKIVSFTNKLSLAQVISKSGKQTIIYVPTGIPISKYRKFEIKYNQYNQKAIEMKLLPVNSQLEIVRNLSKTYCQLFLKHQDSSIEQSQSLKLNKNRIYFNNKTFAYDLDDLIFYVPQSTKLTYELQIQCNCIYVPIVNKQTQFIESYHQNYQLSLLLRPLECQLGEFSQGMNDYCHQCEVDQQQYSVTVGATYCQIVDDQKIQKFTQSQIFLKQSYWRMNITSSSILLCVNQQINCIGGWGVGDDLCQKGYLGPLCEGEGSYQRIHLFECQICEEAIYNRLVNLIMSISLFGLLILLMNYLVRIHIQRIRHNVHLLKRPFKSFYFKSVEVLIWQSIKIIVSYFQIISVMQELSSVFQDGIQTFIDYFGNPFQLLTIFQECQLINLQLSVIYIQILQNLICIILLLTFFVLIICMGSKFLKFKQISNTFMNFTLLFLYYFTNSIIRSLTQLIGFRRIQDYYWVYKNISYNYISNSHLILIFICFLPILIVLGILLPIILLKGLSSSDLLNRRKYFSQIQFWLLSYSNGQTKWEAYKLLLNNGIILIVILIDLNVAFRGVFAYLLLIVYTKLFQLNKVYYHKQMNSFENQLQNINITLLVTQSFLSNDVNLFSPFTDIINILINASFYLGLGFILIHFYNISRSFILTSFCELFEKMGKYSQKFQEYKIFNHHSKSSIEQRQRRFQLIRDCYKKKQNT